MSELTPITRVESYLDAIVNNGIPPTEDITRIETFLQAIYDNQVCALTPITRIEMFLGKISGQDIVLPEPITRIELYLAAIAGEDVELPEMPITRLEMYLAEWADSGDWTTISGAIVEFITQRAHKLKSCVVSLSPIQDLSHGDPSPTNICPISGWTGCEVWRTGKNKFNPAEAQNNKWINGTTGAIENANGYWVTGFIPVKTGDVVRCTAKGSARCAWYNSDKSEATYFGWSGGEGYQTIAIYDGFVILTVLASTVAFGGQFIVTINNSDLTYEPYQGNSYSVTWEDEVYGATPDIVSGEMPVTWDAVDMGELTWTKEANHFYSNVISDAKPPTNNTVPANILSSAYKNIGAYYVTQETTDCTIGLSNSRRLYVYDSAYTDAASFKAAMSGVQLAYELATPIPTAITPTPITALKGYNAMWSNAGDIEVTVHGTPVEVSTQQALNMLLGGSYRNNQTAEDVSDEEALDIILGGEQR